MKAVMRNLDTALDCSKVSFLPPPESHFLSQKPQGHGSGCVITWTCSVCETVQATENHQSTSLCAHLMRKLNAEEEKFGDNWTQEGCLVLELMSS